MDEEGVWDSDAKHTRIDFYLIIFEWKMTLGWDASFFAYASGDEDFTSHKKKEEHRTTTEAIKSSGGRERER